MGGYDLAFELDRQAILTLLTGAAGAGYLTPGHTYNVDLGSVSAMGGLAQGTVTEIQVLGIHEPDQIQLSVRLSISQDNAGALVLEVLPETIDLSVRVRLSFEDLGPLGLVQPHACKKSRNPAAEWPHPPGASIHPVGIFGHFQDAEISWTSTPPTNRVAATFLAESLVQQLRDLGPLWLTQGIRLARTTHSRGLLPCVIAREWRIQCYENIGPRPFLNIFAIFLSDGERRAVNQVGPHVKTESGLARHRSDNPNPIIGSTGSFDPCSPHRADPHDFSSKSDASDPLGIQEQELNPLHSFFLFPPDSPICHPKQLFRDPSPPKSPWEANWQDENANAKRGSFSAAVNVSRLLIRQEMFGPAFAKAFRISPQDLPPPYTATPRWLNTGPVNADCFEAKNKCEKEKALKEWSTATAQVAHAYQRAGMGALVPAFTGKPKTWFWDNNLELVKRARKDQAGRFDPVWALVGRRVEIKDIDFQLGYRGPLVHVRGYMNKPYSVDFDYNARLQFGTRCGRVFLRQTGITNTHVDVDLSFLEYITSPFWIGTLLDGTVWERMGYFFAYQLGFTFDWVTAILANEGVLEGVIEQGTLNKLRDELRKFEPTPSSGPPPFDSFMTRQIVAVDGVVSFVGDFIPCSSYETMSSRHRNARMIIEKHELERTDIKQPETQLRGDPFAEQRRSSPWTKHQVKQEIRASIELQNIPLPVDVDWFIVVEGRMVPLRVKIEDRPLLVEAGTPKSIGSTTSLAGSEGAPMARVHKARRAWLGENIPIVGLAIRGIRMVVETLFGGSMPNEVRPGSRAKEIGSVSIEDASEVLLSGVRRGHVEFEVDSSFLTPMPIVRRRRVRVEYEAQGTALTLRNRPDDGNYAFDIVARIAVPGPVPIECRESTTFVGQFVTTESLRQTKHAKGALHGVDSNQSDLDELQVVAASLVGDSHAHDEKNEEVVDGDGALMFAWLSRQPGPDQLRWAEALVRAQTNERDIERMASLDNVQKSDAVLRFEPINEGGSSGSGTPNMADLELENDGASVDD